MPYRPENSRHGHGDYTQDELAKMNEAPYLERRELFIVPITKTLHNISMRAEQMGVNMVKARIVPSGGYEAYQNLSRKYMATWPELADIKLLNEIDDALNTYLGAMESPSSVTGAAERYKELEEKYFETVSPRPA